MHFAFPWKKTELVKYIIITLSLTYTAQRRNRGEIYGATSAMVGQNLPPPPWLE